jgi:hypothetical protein
MLSNFYFHQIQNINYWSTFWVSFCAGDWAQGLEHDKHTLYNELYLQSLEISLIYPYKYGHTYV